MDDGARIAPTTVRETEAPGVEEVRFVLFDDHSLPDPAFEKALAGEA